MAGTPSYIAPEMADGRVLTKAADVYLRNERNVVARWAILYSLERCGMEGADLLGALSREWKDPFLRYRAEKASTAIRNRLGEDR